MKGIVLIFGILIILSSFVSAECVIPYDGMIIVQNTTLCTGTYTLPTGMSFGANNVLLNCNDSILQGDFPPFSTMPTKNGIGNDQLSDLYILTGKMDISSQGSSVGGIFLSNISGATILNCNLKYYSRAIYLDQSKNNTLASNNFSGNTASIYLRNLSDNNKILQNQFLGYGDEFNTTTVEGDTSGMAIASFLSSNNIYKDNTFKLLQFGIALGDSNYNIVNHNNFSNSKGAIAVGNTTSSYSSYNLFTDNHLINLLFGIQIYTPYNTFYHNNMINISLHAIDSTNLSAWDNGYPSGGNYWSNYSGNDAFKGLNQNVTGQDNIGDTNYNNQYGILDRYPYMQESGWLYSYKLLVNKTNNAGSIVSSPTGINCGSTCSAVYRRGINVTLTATLNSGAVFRGWGGCDSVNGTKCSVLMVANTTLIADMAYTPTLSFSSPKNITYNTSAIAVTITNNSAVKNIWWNNGLENRSYNKTINLEIPNGKYTFYAWGNDSYGNIANTSVTFRINDTIAPLVSFTSPKNQNYTTKQITVTITNNSEAKNIWWFNGDNYFIYNKSLTLNLTDGKYTFWAYANDTAGNIGSANVTFNIDTIIPTFTNYWDSNGTLSGNGLGIFYVIIRNTNSMVFLNMSGQAIPADNPAPHVYSVFYNFTSPGVYKYNWIAYGSGVNSNRAVSLTRYYTVLPAKTIAYIVKSADNPNLKIVNIITGMGYNYTLIPENLISITNFSKYSMILLGDEDIRTAPVNDYKSLFINPYYYSGWAAFIGSSASNRPLKANNTNAQSPISKNILGQFQVYTGCCDGRGDALPMYFLDGPKRSGVERITSTKANLGEYVVATKQNPRRIFFVQPLFHFPS